MFPNPKDAPAGPAQGFTDQPVTGLVMGKFLFPKRPVAGGVRAVLGAGVPKTTVHENGQSDPGENEVRLAEDFLIPTPAGDLVPAE